MIVGVSIRNFKAIKFLDRLPLADFQVLVGPNGAGKSTFLDAIDFVRDCLIHGPRVAVEMRDVAEFRDLTWNRLGGGIFVELIFDLSADFLQHKGNVISYYILIKQDNASSIEIGSEGLIYFSNINNNFFLGKRYGAKQVNAFIAVANKNFVYHDEKVNKKIIFNFGSDRLALSMLPPDEERFPTANAIKRFLMEGIRFIQLNSRAMRLPCPATRGVEYELDGSNLARVVGRLLQQDSVVDERGVRWPTGDNPVIRWAEHLRYALPDLAAIGATRRLADNAEYLVLRYDSGLEAPSWLLSDGTLRMLALTLPAFLPFRPALYLVEEPENGVHPKALEIIMGSLSAIPGGKTMVASHSPLVIQQAGRDALLCFRRDEDGVKIIPGAAHPALQDWDGTPDLATIFAAGVLE